MKKDINRQQPEILIKILFIAGYGIQSGTLYVAKQQTIPGLWALQH